VNQPRREEEIKVLIAISIATYIMRKMLIQFHKEMASYSIILVTLGVVIVQVAPLVVTNVEMLVDRLLKE
jgi:hypothetical protein